MNDRIRYFKQDEYSRILNLNNAREQGLSQSECERILVNAGATYEQAKNGSYVFIHHSNHNIARIRTTQSQYNNILDDFKANKKQPKDCIQHLEQLGFSYGQAKSAVYKYRLIKNLI